VAAHGLRGELAVESLSDVPRRFAAGAELFLRQGDAPGRPVRIESSRPHKGHLLLTLDGIADRTAAEALRGALLEIEEREVPPPPADGYYHFQLEGCRCVDRRDGDLGTVQEVVEGGGGTLLRVDGPHGELLLPFVDEYLEEVDVARRKIAWHLPEGLVDPEKGL